MNGSGSYAGTARPADVCGRWMLTPDSGTDYRWIVSPTPVQIAEDRLLRAQRSDWYQDQLFAHDAGLVSDYVILRGVTGSHRGFAMKRNGLHYGEVYESSELASILGSYQSTPAPVAVAREIIQRKLVARLTHALLLAKGNASFAAGLESNRATIAQMVASYAAEMGVSPDEVRANIRGDDQPLVVCMTIVAPGKRGDGTKRHQRIDPLVKG